MLRKYPIGLQSFRKIREGGYVYIDKTELIHQLVEARQYYFLSRPRRFGKSLLVDTIEELFSGSKDLFEGLWILDKWDWTKTNPVIHFSFANLGVKTSGLEEAIYGALQENADRLGVFLTKKGYDLQFRELVEKASEKGQVVILIDEYDKPIVDFLDEPEQLDTNRSIMKGFYSILKARDEQIRLLLITGVSQFSCVSVFSDLNNLRNITMVPQYGGLVGVTQQELEVNFAVEITEMQKSRPDILRQIKEWYDGYTWDMQTWVYNPFTLLNFMAWPEFNGYWYETGTPTILLRLLKKNNKFDVEGLRLSGNILSSFNTDNPSPGALLFQTGHLTIKNISPDRQLYELGYPNREVKANLLDGLLSIYRGREDEDNLASTVDLQATLKRGDVAGMILHLNAMIADIPYDYWEPKNESIFTIITSIIFKKIGMDVTTEVHNAWGRCDILVKTNLYIYVLELKLNRTAEEAMEQIREKGYLKAYAADPRKKIAVGISFSSKKLQVADYLVQEY